MTTAARKPLDEQPLGLSLSALWDPELETNALGAAMLGEPMPPWLEPHHFFPTQHQSIYAAVLTVGANPAHVNAWIRESSPPFSPPVAKSTDIAAICIEAKWALRMGWSLQLERIRELWQARRLVECMTRQAILLRNGQATHADCYAALKEHFKVTK